MKLKMMLFLIIPLMVACSRDDVSKNEEITLRARWEIDEIIVFNSCEYEVSLKDFDFHKVNVLCQDDDIYDFRDHKILSINYGNIKCDVDKPKVENKPYKIIDKNKIKIGEIEYNIIFLDKNTLVLDSCEEMNLSNPYHHNPTMKVGIRFKKIE